MIKYKFCPVKDREFSSTLRLRVNQYFKENNIDRSGNVQMTTKVIIYLSVYLIPFGMLLLGGFTSLTLLAALWMIIGLGKALIGLNIMHDSVHGSITKNKVLSRLLRFSGTLIGVDWLIWKIQHNVLHHTYTNIEHADEDILPRVIFRFSTNQPLHWFHKYQHIYAPLFYCVPLLEWLTTKDFVKAIDYRKMGLIKKEDFALEFSRITFRKLFYYAIFIAIPIWLINIPVWITIVMILVSNCITGIILAMVFQTAHVIPDTAFIQPDSENINECWTTHQLLTTSNYGTDDKVLTFLVGGLNFQVEHHLFPDICHVHYPSISKIVEKTAREFGIPYLSLACFGTAVGSHFRHLRLMGLPTVA